MEKITIGVLAKKSGLSIVSLRYYEKIGLITKATRSSSGYRLYPESLIPRINFIKKAKSLGFSLEEVSQLLKLHESEESSMPVRNKVQDKLKDVQGKISDLKILEKTLKKLLSTCDGRGSMAECPIIEHIYSSDEQ